MGNPIAVRAAIESEHNATRDAREKQYVADRNALENTYHQDLHDIEQTKIEAYVDAGLNPDGSTPPTFDRDSPVNITAPAVTGTPTTGQTLTSTNGVWSRSDGEVYQWLRDGVAIAGATANTHVLVVGDQGKAISCRVTATNESGSTSAVSNAVNATA